MEAPREPKDSSIHKRKSSGSREAVPGEGEGRTIPSLVQLVPISTPVQQSPVLVQDSEENDMLDRPVYSPSFNPDDLFAFPFPYVPPLSHDALDKRFRSSRAQIQGDAYQALFRDLIRPGPSDDNVPCGSCPCCQRMLSYVSSLRTVLDHMVDDIMQKSPAGTRVAPCALCLQEHRDHQSHEEQFELNLPPQPDKRRRSRSREQPRPTDQDPVQGPRRSHDTEARPRRPSAPRPPPEKQLGDSGPKGHQEGQPVPSASVSQPAKETTRSGHPAPEATSQQKETPERISEDISQQRETHRNEQQSSESRQELNWQEQQSSTPETQEEEVLSSNTPESPAPIRTPTHVPNTEIPSKPPESREAVIVAEEPSRAEEEDRTWREARAQLLEPPSLSPRENHSPVVSHGGQYIFTASDPSRPRNEAYVTIASDNLSALCCLVLGNSLRLTETTRSLAVIVTDGVSGVLRHLLQIVFDVVQGVGVMDSQGSTKLALLEQPELGVSFTKPYVWSLEQFTKCVFLESDTLVVQNCDELFEREELSAVPDIGWPDCFNSGVFVFSPSQDTFWKLIHFAEQQDSFDGGDQGLLNLFFRGWASDISRKLPFLYNLMANVSYTYKPAFKHFGRGVKIVHFFGSYKPWNVQFHPQTGQMAPGSNVHPTYAQFVHFWLEIYTKRVLPIFSQEIQDHMYSQEYTCPHEVLQFIPSPVRQLESLPTPPSFRVYGGDKPRDQPSIVDSILQLSLVGGESDANQSEEPVTLEATSENEEKFAEQEPEEPVDPNAIPGSDIDDFQNMAAWEQGRMDYMGQAKSDTIMKRLDFLIQGKR